MNITAGVWSMNACSSSFCRTCPSARACAISMRRPTTKAAKMTTMNTAT